MKRIVLETPGRFAVQEVEVPRPGPGQALVRVRKVGICGSDVHLYRSGRIGETRLEGPFVIGHECVARVEAVGQGVGGELVGRRVAVEPAVSCGHCPWCAVGKTNICPTVKFLGTPPTPGALQEYLVHPARLLESLPDKLSDSAGVVLEPTAIALHAIRLMKVRPGQRVAVLGTGVVGTCVLTLLGLYRGLRVVCVDIVEDRLERARSMGADATVNAAGLSDEEAAARTKAAIGGYGADVVFECAGVPQTNWNMCEVAAPDGHIAVIGITDDDRIAFNHSRPRRKGVTLRLVRRSLHTLRPCVELAVQGAIPLEKLVTHVLPAGQVEKAFELAAASSPGVLKVLVDMESW